MALWRKKMFERALWRKQRVTTTFHSFINVRDHISEFRGWHGGNPAVKRNLRCQRQGILSRLFARGTFSRRRLMNKTIIYGNYIWDYIWELYIWEDHTRKTMKSVANGISDRFLAKFDQRSVHLLPAETIEAPSFYHFPSDFL